MTNIYDSMNHYFDTKIAAVEQKSKLAESVDKPVEEFQELVIPEPFIKYYRIIRPEEYEDILGYEYDVKELEEAAEEAGVESIQYAILRDGFDTDGEVKIVSICKDADNVFVGIDIGGRVYPADFDEIISQIKEVEKVNSETNDSEMSSEKVEESVKEEDLTYEAIYRKLCKKYGYHVAQYELAVEEDEILTYRFNAPNDFIALIYALFPGDAIDPQHVDEDTMYVEDLEEISRKSFKALKDDLDSGDSGSLVLYVRNRDTGEIIYEEKARLMSTDRYKWNLKDFQVSESLEEDLNPWERLVRVYPELAEESLKESVKEEDDLWDEVYGKLTMDGELVPSSTGKSFKFNQGAGYRYADQVWTGSDGEICVGAETLEELKAAADVAESYVDRGVSYRLRRGTPNRDKFPFIIEIAVPYEEE